MKRLAQATRAQAQLVRARSALKVARDALQCAAESMYRLSDRAGDVEEWNEKGHAYEAAKAVRAALRRTERGMK